MYPTSASSENGNQYPHWECYLCSKRVNERTSGKSTTEQDLKQLHDICCKYLHSAITKDVSDSKLNFSNGEHYPKLCQNCFSSAVELGDLAEQLDFLQRKVYESTLIFSLGIFHRRHKVTNHTLENSRSSSYSTQKLLEFDVSVFPNIDFGVPDFIDSFRSVSPREADNTPSEGNIVDSDSPESVFDHSIEVKVENVLMEYDNTDEEDLDADFETENFKPENVIEQSTLDDSNLLLANYDQTGGGHTEYDFSILPVIKLERLDLSLMSNVANGRDKITSASNSHAVTKRVRKKKSFPEEENYTLDFRKIKMRKKRQSEFPDEPIRSNELTGGLSTDLQGMTHGTTETENGNSGKPKLGLSEWKIRRKVGRPRKLSTSILLLRDKFNSAEAKLRRRRKTTKPRKSVHKFLNFAEANGGVHRKRGRPKKNADILINDLQTQSNPHSTETLDDSTHTNTIHATQPQMLTVVQQMVSGNDNGKQKVRRPRKLSQFQMNRKSPLTASEIRRGMKTSVRNVLHDSATESPSLLLPRKVGRPKKSLAPNSEVNIFSRQSDALNSSTLSSSAIAMEGPGVNVPKDDITSKNLDNSRFLHRRKAGRPKRYSLPSESTTSSVLKHLEAQHTSSPILHVEAITMCPEMQPQTQSKTIDHEIGEMEKLPSRKFGNPKMVLRISSAKNILKLPFANSKPLLNESTKAILEKEEIDTQKVAVDAESPNTIIAHQISFRKKVGRPRRKRDFTTLKPKNILQLSDLQTVSTQLLDLTSEATLGEIEVCTPKSVADKESRVHRNPIRKKRGRPKNTFKDKNSLSDPQICSKQLLNLTTEATLGELEVCTPETVVDKESQVHQVPNRKKRGRPKNIFRTFKAKHMLNPSVTQAITTQLLDETPGTISKEVEVCNPEIAADKESQFRLIPFHRKLDRRIQIFRIFKARNNLKKSNNQIISTPILNTIPTGGSAMEADTPSVASVSNEVSEPINEKEIEEVHRRKSVRSKRISLIPPSTIALNQLVPQVVSTVSMVISSVNESDAQRVAEDINPQKKKRGRPKKSLFEPLASQSMLKQTLDAQVVLNGTSTTISPQVISSTQEIPVDRANESHCEMSIHREGGLSGTPVADNLSEDKNKHAEIPGASVSVSPSDGIPIFKTLKVQISVEDQTMASSPGKFNASETKIAETSKQRGRPRKISDVEYELKNKGKYKCEICNKGFSRPSAVEIHKRIHTGERPFKCAICQKTFNRFYHLAAHRLIHRVENPLSCQRCGKDCSDASDDFLKTKMTPKNIIVNRSDGKHPCTVCNKEFTTRTQSWIHRRIHHKEKRPFKCTICEKAFAKQYDLSRHQNLLHFNNEAFTCKDCTKDVQEKQVKNSPQISPRSFKTNLNCDICGKEFNSPFQVLYHKRIHNGERPYKCPECPRTFALETSLARHTKCMERHPNHGLAKTQRKGGNYLKLGRCHVKTSACPVCSKTFSQYCNMTRHILGVHEKQQPYKCSSCGKRFSIAANLERHKAIIHRKEKNFKCSFCGKECSTKSDMFNHIRTHTSEKPFKCGQCNYCTTRRTFLNMHIRSKHPISEMTS